LVLSQEIVWEEHHRNDLFCRVGRKTWIKQTDRQIVIFFSCTYVVFFIVCLWS